jgi:hypothetical protein
VSQRRCSWRDVRGKRRRARQTKRPPNHKWPKVRPKANHRIVASSPRRCRLEGDRSKPSDGRASSRMAAGRLRRTHPACRSRSTRYRRRQAIQTRTPSHTRTPNHTTGGIPRSMARPSLSAVQFSSRVVFTVSTMTSSTTVAFTTGAVLPTAGFTEAGGERQALLRALTRAAIVALLAAGS